MRFDHLFSTLDNSPINQSLQGLEGFPLIPAFLGAQAGQTLNHLTIHGIKIYQLKSDPPAKKAVQKALSAIGSPIDDDAWYYKTRGGWLNANPAVICALPFEKDGEDGFQIISIAREGLINQKTVVKVMKRFETALRQQDVAFLSDILIEMSRLE